MPRVFSATRRSTSARIRLSGWADEGPSSRICSNPCHASGPPFSSREAEIVFVGAWTAAGVCRYCRVASSRRDLVLRSATALGAFPSADGGQRCSNRSYHLKALPRCCQHADWGGLLMCVLLCDCGGRRVGAEEMGGGRPVSRRGTTRRAAPVRVLGTFGIPAACPGATRATRYCAILAAGAQRNVAPGTRSGKGRRVVLHERRSTLAGGSPRAARRTANRE